MSADGDAAAARGDGGRDPLDGGRGRPRSASWRGPRWRAAGRPAGARSGPSAAAGWLRGRVAAGLPRRPTTPNPASSVVAGGDRRGRRVHRRLGRRRRGIVVAVAPAQAARPEHAGDGSGRRRLRRRRGVDLVCGLPMGVRRAAIGGGSRASMAVMPAYERDILDEFADARKPRTLPGGRRRAAAWSSRTAPAGGAATSSGGRSRPSRCATAATTSATSPGSRAGSCSRAGR